MERVSMRSSQRSQALRRLWCMRYLARHNTSSIQLWRHCPRGLIVSHTKSILIADVQCGLDKNACTLGEIASMHVLTFLGIIARATGANSPLGAVADRRNTRPG